MIGDAIIIHFESQVLKNQYTDYTSNNTDTEISPTMIESGF